MDGFATFLHSEVPHFLRDSDFYLSLDDGDGEPISIPTDCARFNLSIRADELEGDLRSLLNTFRFWGVYRLLHITEFTTFILTARNKTLCRNVLSEFEAELSEMRVLIKILGGKTQVEALCTAISLGEFQLVKIMASNNYTFSQSCVVAAAQHNRVDCLEFLLSEGCTWEPRLMNIAAKQGHVDILKFAHERGLERGFAVCAAAADAGHLSCLQYAYENGHTWVEKVCPVHNLPIALYARSIGAVWAEYTCCDAAKLGSIDVLQYLHEGNDYPYPISNSALVVAVWMGHTDCVRYLRSINIQWTGAECEFAAYRGHLDTLKYLHESGCRCSMITSWMCTIHDEVECLQYLHERGIWWDCTTPRSCSHKRADLSSACPFCTKVAISHWSMGATIYLGLIDQFERVGQCWYREDPRLGRAAKAKPDLFKIHGELDKSCTFGIAALCTYYKARRCLRCAYNQRCAWPDNPFLLPNASDKLIRRCIHELCTPSSTQISANNLHKLCCPTNKHTLLSALTVGDLLKSPGDYSSFDRKIRVAIAKTSESNEKYKEQSREKKLSKWGTFSQQLCTIVQRDLYSYRVADSFFALSAMIVLSAANAWLSEYR